MPDQQPDDQPDDAPVEMFGIVWGTVIDAYSRAQAVADGVLVDVTAEACETGFRFPVAMTSAAWSDTVEWTPQIEARKPEHTGQDQRGRLHEVLLMTYLAIRRAGHTAPSTPVDVVLLRIPPTGAEVEPQLVTLKARAGSGDNAEPVLTPTLPGED